MKSEIIDEQNLWKSFQEGNEESYTLIYSKFVKTMFRYGMSLVPVSEAFVLDCIHDVFTEIWIKRERLSVPDNIKYYLLKSLKTRILHLLKRQEKPSMPLNDVDYEDLWFEPSAEDIFAENEWTENRERVIGRLIKELPHRQQEALRLRFIENLDYEQVAEIMDVNRQSAQNLVFRAIEKLRNKITLILIVFLELF